MARTRYNSHIAGKATILWDEDSQLYKCEFPLVWVAKGKMLPKHQEFMDIFKQRVPACDRIWRPEQHDWLVHEKWFDGLSALMEVYFGNVFKFKKPEAQANFNVRTYSTEADILKFGDLLKECGALNGTPVKEFDLAVATKYYRKAAMFYHPDRNPQLAGKMSELNEVWARLSKDTPERKAYFK